MINLYQSYGLKPTDSTTVRAILKKYHNAELVSNARLNAMVVNKEVYEIRTEQSHVWSYLAIPTHIKRVNNHKSQAVLLMAKFDDICEYFELADVPDIKYIGTHMNNFINRFVQTELYTQKLSNRPQTDIQQTELLVNEGSEKNSSPTVTSVDNNIIQTDTLKTEDTDKSPNENAPVFDYTCEEMEALDTLSTCVMKFLDEKLIHSLNSNYKLPYADTEFKYLLSRKIFLALKSIDKAGKKVTQTGVIYTGQKVIVLLDTEILLNGFETLKILISMYDARTIEHLTINPTLTTIKQFGLNPNETFNYSKIERQLYELVPLTRTNLDVNPGLILTHIFRTRPERLPDYVTKMSDKLNFFYESLTEQAYLSEMGLSQVVPITLLHLNSPIGMAIAVPLKTTKRRKTNAAVILRYTQYNTWEVVTVESNMLLNVNLLSTNALCTPDWFELPPQSNTKK